MKYNTLEKKIPYPGLKKTLQYLVKQAEISVPYCQERWGTNNTLYGIWEIGKSNLIYKRDKYGIEQIQSVGTIFENNIHGISGAGDCDCFTVFTIAMLLANNFAFHDIRIYLQGNSKQYPSHILTKYQLEFIDFTEPRYNQLRNYKNFQDIPIWKI